MFAGTQAVTLALQARGFITIPYDIVLDAGMNLLTNEGFSLALNLVRRMKPTG